MTKVGLISEAVIIKSTTWESYAEHNYSLKHDGQGYMVIVAPKAKVK